MQINIPTLLVFIISYIFIQRQIGSKPLKLILNNEQIVLCLKRDS